MKIGKIMRTGAAALFGVVGVAVTATSASAFIACNKEGDCWHTDRRDNVPGVTFEYHPDDWYFHQHWNGARRFREYHDGRGYWHNGVWVQL